MAGETEPMISLKSSIRPAHDSGNRDTWNISLARFNARSCCASGRRKELSATALLRAAYKFGQRIVGIAQIGAPRGVHAGQKRHGDAFPHAHRRRQVGGAELLAPRPPIQMRPFVAGAQRDDRRIRRGRTNQTPRFRHRPDGAPRPESACRAARCFETTAAWRRAASANGGRSFAHAAC